MDAGGRDLEARRPRVQRHAGAFARPRRRRHRIRCRQGEPEFPPGRARHRARPRHRYRCSRARHSPSVLALQEQPALRAPACGTGSTRRSRPRGPPPE